MTSVTITLHWWYVPALLVAVAVAIMLNGRYRPGGGMFDGLAEVMFAGLLILLAVAVCVGHWL